MKLSVIHESRTATYFKCLRPPEYKKFLRTKIPGYIGTPKLASNYIVLGHEFEPVYIVAMSVDTSLVKDMSHVVDDMCCSPNSGWRAEYPELTSEIWTAWGSAHGDTELGGLHGIYYGQPIKNFKVIDHIPDLEYYQSKGGWEYFQRRMEEAAK